jgi:ribosome-associated protein
VSAEGALPVDANLEIPRSELSFRSSRAGGPGGQHVNTSSTRIELLWNVERSRALSSDQRQRVRDKLSARMDGDGNIRVVASANRSQLRNREDAELRLAALVRSALLVPKRRRKTRPTRGAVEKRLRAKKEHSRRKENRRYRPDDQ